MIDMNRLRELTAEMGSCQPPPTRPTSSGTGSTTRTRTTGRPVVADRDRAQEGEDLTHDGRADAKAPQTAAGAPCRVVGGGTARRAGGRQPDRRGLRTSLSRHG